MKLTNVKYEFEKGYIVEFERVPDSEAPIIKTENIFNGHPLRWSMSVTNGSLIYGDSSRFVRKPTLDNAKKRLIELGILKSKVA